jgi:hypothetical protein
MGSRAAPTPGSCTPSGGAPTKAAPSFAQLSRVCAAARTGGGCAAGAACVAKPTGTAHGVCLSQPLVGSALCPTAYAHPHVVSPDGLTNDTRGCTACTCGAPTGAACNEQITLHTGAGCDDPDGGLFDDAGAALGSDPATFAGNNTCQTGLVSAAEAFVSGIMTTSVATDGTCAAAAATPTGSVTVTTQVQYCCQN